MRGDPLLRVQSVPSNGQWGVSNSGEKFCIRQRYGKTPSISVELVNANKEEGNQRGDLKVKVGTNTKLSTKPYCISSLKVDLSSCSRLDDFGTANTSHRGRCTLFSKRNGNTVYESISKRCNNGLFSATVVTTSQLVKYEHPVLHHLEAV